MRDAQGRVEITYGEFVRTFENAVAEFAAQGFKVVKVPVDVGQMVAWCLRTADIDAAGRRSSASR